MGDVLHCPYSEKDPIVTRTGDRALTLLDLQELSRTAKTRNRHVVLVAGHCADCGRLKADALLPLLRSPDLKVWTQVVMDTDTAREVLALASS